MDFYSFLFIIAVLSKLGASSNVRYGSFDVTVVLNASNVFKTFTFVLSENF